MIVNVDHDDTLQLRDVVGIVPLSNRIVDRLKAYLDLGFTIAKANWATTLSVSGEVAYRGPKVGTSASFSAYSQTQEDVASTRRGSIDLDGERYVANRWKYLTLTTFEHNDELGLDLRVTLGGGVGRAFVQNNSHEVSLEATIVGTREDFIATPSGTAPEWNLEGRFAATWDAFRYDFPKLDLSTDLTVFPSITTPGRVRVDTNIRLRYELFREFTVGIDFTDSYDNQPPEETASTNDFVSTFTIGWSYRR
jgi:putative salt-induced outer membrane protein YdiY